MVEQIINCTELLEDWFGNETTDGNSKEKMISAQFFCEKVSMYDNSLPTKEYFNGFCCKNDFLNEMCKKFIEEYLRHEKFNVVCSPYEIYSYVLIGVCVPLGIPANILILLLNLRHHILPKQTSYFLCSLSAGDIGVIANFIALTVYQKSNPNVSKRVNEFLMPSVHVFFVSISLLQISVISIERAIAVTWPLLYPTFVTRSRAKYITIIVWIWSMTNLIISLLRIPVQSTVYKSSVFYIYLITLLVFPIVVVLFSYLLISLSAFQNIRHDKVRAKLAVNLLKTSRVQQKRSSGWSIHSMRQKEIKVSVNVAVMVLPFLCCWIFFTFTHVYEILTHYQFSGISNWFILALPMIVSSTNPVAYIILTKPLRKKTQAFLKKHSRMIFC